MGPAGLRLEEVEPAALLDPAVVVNRKPHRVPERRGVREVHGECVSRPVELEYRTPRGRDRPDLESPIHVQPDDLEPGAKGAERGDHPAIERRRIPVEIADLDTLVEQIEIVGGSVPAVDDPLLVGLGRKARHHTKKRQEDGRHTRGHPGNLCRPRPGRLTST